MWEHIGAYAGSRTGERGGGNPGADAATAAAAAVAANKRAKETCAALSVLGADTARGALAARGATVDWDEEAATEAAVALAAGEAKIGTDGNVYVLWLADGGRGWTVCRMIGLGQIDIVWKHGGVDWINDRRAEALAALATF